MKADLYVQGRFWATVLLPGDSLLALLAQGMIAQATDKAAELQSDLGAIEGVKCSISLRYKVPVTYETDTPDPTNPSQPESTHAD